MSVCAYVLIEAMPLKSGNIAKKILEIDGVKSAFSVTGPFDVIAFVEKEDLNSLGKTIANEIQSVEGIVRTTTCVVMEI
ncbi:MAG: Lrp/AsnC ligand binding domain-containing protein [Acidobacteriota bacterium]